MKVCKSGKYLFTGGKNRNLTQWRIEDMSIVKDYGEIHGDKINCMEIVGDKWLFTGCDGGRLKMWDIQKKKLWKDYGVVHKRGIKCLRVTSNVN